MLASQLCLKDRLVAAIGAVRPIAIKHSAKGFYRSHNGRWCMTSILALPFMDSLFATAVQMAKSKAAKVKLPAFLITYGGELI